MKGEVVFYRLFDLGASVDLDEIQGTVDMPFLAGRMLSERATPKYARFAAPLLVYVDQRTLETNVGSLVASIASSRPKAGLNDARARVAVGIGMSRVRATAMAASALYAL